MAIFTINIENLEAITQFKSLPSTFVKNANIYRITTGLYKEKPLIIDGEIKLPYDLTIKADYDNIADGWRSRTMACVTLHRYNKATQQALLLSHVKFLDSKRENKFQHYRHLSTSTLDKVTGNHYLHGGDYLIKPDAGARGVGILKATPETNLRGFMFELNKFLDGDEQGLTKEKLIELCDKFKITKFEGNDRQVDEDIVMIKGQGLITQDLNTSRNVKEYRVLKTLNEIIILERNHLDATEPNRVEKVIYHTNIIGNTVFSTELHEEIVAILESAYFPLQHGSIDLWVSKQDQTWGIYEFQNQYSHLDVPEHVHLDFLKQSIILLMGSQPT